MCSILLLNRNILQKNIPGAQLLSIASDYGHDGFLLEYEKIESALRKFIQERSSHHLKVVNG